MTDSSPKPQKRIAFQLRIKSAQIDLPDNTILQVLWIRGMYTLHYLTKINRKLEDRHQSKAPPIKIGHHK